MDVAKWSSVAKEFSSSLELRGLDDDQLRALIELLALTIHADSKVSPVEVAGFNHLFFDLDWLSDRQELVREHIPKAAERAAVDGDAEAGLALARSAAEQLRSAEIRSLVFRISASLAAIDQRLVLRENRALGWIAEAFDIDTTEREAVIAEMTTKG